MNRKWTQPITRTVIIHPIIDARRLFPLHKNKNIMERNASLSDVCDSFVHVVEQKKIISNRQLYTVLNGHCSHCSSKSNPKYPFWDWFDCWKWYEMVFFFKPEFGQHFAMVGFFFFRKKKWLNPMTNINDDYFLWHTVFDEDD